MKYSEFKASIKNVFPKEKWEFSKNMEAKSPWMAASIIEGRWVFSNAAAFIGYGDTLKEAILDAHSKQSLFLTTI